MNENQITTSQDEGFSDFASAFGDDIDYQTDTEPEIDAEEPTEEPADDSQEPVDDEGDKEPSQEENNAPEGDEPPETPAESFTIRVNKEDKSVSREEMISLAQKGFDYDRVKQQRDEAKAEAESLQKYKGYESILDMLSIISEASNMTPDQLMDSVYINMRRGQGMDEAAAKEALRADKLQRQVSAMEKQNTQNEQVTNAEDARARTEMAEFRKEYPEKDVPLTQELVDKLKGDVQSGMTLLRAYEKLKHEEALSAEKNRIEALERELAAERQNKRNRAKSPGSQTDSGGKRGKSDFDDFANALFG